MSHHLQPLAPAPVDEYAALVQRVRSHRQAQDMHELDRMIDTHGLDVVEGWVRGARAIREPQVGLISDPRR